MLNWVKIPPRKRGIPTKDPKGEKTPMDLPPGTLKLFSNENKTLNNISNASLTYFTLSKLVAWITMTQHLSEYYILLLNRIGKLIISSSSTWAFAYMKEVMRLTVRALTGVPEMISDNPT